jgi:hypothetical protein
MENQVSIIINGDRYDSVEDDNSYCCGCDLLDLCKFHCDLKLCENLGVNLGFVFKKSDKPFEK